MDQEEKRQVPSFLKKILDVDVYLTKVFVNSLEKYLPVRQLQTHYKALEISCHGIPWIALTLASIWIFHLTSLYQLQVNLFIALTRRRRPAVNDDPFAIGPDKYSFPSGHASRCTFIVYYFLYLWPLPIIFVPSLLAWCTCVCLSRLLMRRHNILDVGIGIILGILEGMIIGYMYLSQDTCINLVTWITNEKIDDV
ncbi:polyisoprenoid diphosphate/phosphate phosphohydrolase PLPP6 isoform X2 [Vespa velutina]|uniref:polyisoprenoid diphosphate/phosphate phosphohydrolase PLPP6 isoform X2 n=1 Tax=Vespa velutina TaxID=202808 RepID=UPI001FB47838|nr:polyisoprenoid diphosphate/phosphate phosphohydrolase PLPP6 isoform X2 [Vespa velutina]